MNAVEFLQWFRPNGPWVLTAIVPDKGTTTATFKKDKVKNMEAWIASHNGVNNLYFQVNATGDKIITKKTSKGDIIAAEWLHVDVDPSADAELFEADRARILQKLKNYVPAPSLIIDSGGGYQAFWRLTSAYKPESYESPWVDFERYNRQIELDLGGDHCHNVDRIMRLPGTVNVPGKKKRARGRKEAPTQVVHTDEITFALDVFSQAPVIDGGDRGDIGRPSVQLSGNLPQLDTVDDLDEWGVSGHVKMLIVQGMDPDQPDKYPSRSECFWRVICELARCEVPDDIIASVILDDGFQISGHVLDQKNPQGYAVRQIQRAKEHSVNPVLTEMNDQYFVTFVGGKVRVVEEINHPKTGRFLEYKTHGDFKSYYSNQKVEIGRDQNTGAPIFMERGKWWYTHPNRRSYKGLIFDPSGDSPPEWHNIWRGFSVAPKAGDKHLRFLKHLKDNICGGNEEYYQYLIQWCARIFQHPDTQSETAVVMRGKEGTGKNTFVHYISRLVADHYFEATSPKQITGEFNAHLRDKVLVHANEAFFAGDPRQSAALKGMITDPTLAIEAKGIDITQEPNYMHLIMSSNDDWVVPAGPDARRYFVLDVSDAQMQNDEYFTPLHRDMQNGGMENLLKFFLDMDLSKFNVRSMPITEALADQKLQSMAKDAQWLMGVLERGFISNPDHIWTDDIPREWVHNAYLEEMKNMGEFRRMGHLAFGKWLKKALPGVESVDRTVQGKRGGYSFPSIEECRAAFDDRYGGPFEWPELQPQIQGEVPF